MEHRIKIQKTARYFTYGENVDRAETVWFVLHGYGQLAKYFVRRFEPLDPVKNFVVAPEGLHRFYLEGFSGRVGASWMTKEARLDDIEDYIGYLSEVYDQVLGNHSNSRIVGLGFSQGVATLARWMALGDRHFDAAVFWAGSFPPDLDPIAAKQALAHLKVFVATGDEDPFINEKSLGRNKAHLDASDLKAKWTHYRGGHSIPRGPLLSLASDIENI